MMAYNHLEIKNVDGIAGTLDIYITNQPSCSVCSNEDMKWIDENGNTQADCGAACEGVVVDENPDACLDTKVCSDLDGNPLEYGLYGNENDCIYQAECLDLDNIPVGGNAPGSSDYTNKNFCETAGECQDSTGVVLENSVLYANEDNCVNAAECNDENGEIQDIETKEECEYNDFTWIDYNYIWIDYNYTWEELDYQWGPASDLWGTTWDSDTTIVNSALCDTTDVWYDGTLKGFQFYLKGVTLNNVFGGISESVFDYITLNPSADCDGDGEADDGCNMIVGTSFTDSYLTGNTDQLLISAS
ncbi:uncharacterized protein METZ01_LOCUS374285, partial [marine metagenome]